MTNNDDNFDDIDLNELFNDFDPSPSLSLPRSPLKDSSRSKSSDEMTEFHETDCTAPRVPPHNRKMVKAKKKKKSTAQQTTMYDYASTVSYKHQEFYSSLDNSTTMKTITRGQKRFSRNHSEPNPKRNKTIDSPDLVDRLLDYLDRRSRVNSSHREKENFSK